MTDDQKNSLSADKKWLQYAFVLNGGGGARHISSAELDSWSERDGVLWLHMDLNRPETHDWIHNKGQIDPTIADLLLDEDEVRPRCMAFGDNLLLFMRAVNLNPGEERDDMISLRVYCESGRIITVRESPLLSLIDVEQKLRIGRGPKSAGELLDEICYVNLDKIIESVDDFDDRMNEMEENIIKGTDTDNFIPVLSEMRRALTEMRRYLSPEKYALEVLSRQTASWLTKDNLYQLRENANLLMRILDDIGSLRERAMINIDELANQVREETQKNINMLSVLAAVSLPFTFVTGLMGMNVGGIPFAQDENGLLVVTLVLTGFAALLLYVFKRLKWL